MDCIPRPHFSEGEVGFCIGRPGGDYILIWVVFNSPIFNVTKRNRNRMRAIQSRTYGKLYVTKPVFSSGIGGLDSVILP